MLQDGDAALARDAIVNATALAATGVKALFLFLVARLLGSAALGLYAVAFGAVDLLSQVAALGLDVTAVVWIARRHAVDDQAGMAIVTKRVLLLGLGGAIIVGLVSAAVIVATADLRADRLSAAILLMLAALPGMVVARIAICVSRGAGHMRHDLYARGLTETWTMAIVFGMALALGLGEWSPIVGAIAGSSASAIVACVLVIRHIGVSDTRPPVLPVTTRGLLASAIPLGLSNLVNLSNNRVALLALGAFADRAPGVTLATAGYFSAAWQLSNLVRQLRQVFDGAVLPALARADESADAHQLRRRVAQAARWVLAAELPLVAVLVLAGASLLALYGRDFPQVYPWLICLAIAQAAHAFTGAADNLLLTRHPRLILVNGLAVLAVQSALVIALTMGLGAIGAVIGVSVGLVGHAALRLIELRQITGWSWPWRETCWPLVLFLPALMVGLVIRAMVPGLLGALLATALAIAMYAIGWRRLGGYPEDRAAWHRGLRLAFRPLRQTL